MKRKFLELQDYSGAISVMENYLEGAVADYENGDVENDYLIESCINTIKLIYTLCEPICLYGTPREYEERMKLAKQKLGK